MEADTYLGRRSASLMKEFWTLCIFVITMIRKQCEEKKNVGVMDVRSTVTTFMTGRRISWSLPNYVCQERCYIKSDYQNCKKHHGAFTFYNSSSQTLLINRP